MKKIVAISGSIAFAIFSTLTIGAIQLGDNKIIMLFTLLTVTAFTISAIAFVIAWVVEKVENKPQLPNPKNKACEGLYFPMYKMKSPGLRKKISLLLLYAEDLAKEKYLYVINRTRRGLAWR